MSGKANFVRGVASGWVALLVTAVVQIFQIRLARRAFTEEEFVLFSVLSNLVSTFLIVEFGMRSAFSRLLLDREGTSKDRSSELWSTGSCVFGAQAGLIVVLGAAVLPFIPGWFNVRPDMTWTARAVFVSLCAQTAVSYAFSNHFVALIANQRFVLVNGLTMFSAAAGLIVFYLSLRNGAGLWATVLGGMPALLISVIVVPFFSRFLKISRGFRFDQVTWSAFREVFLLGLDLFWVGVYNLILAHTLVLFAGNMLPLGIVAHFAVNLKLVQLVLQAAQRMPGTAEPILARIVAEGRITDFRRAWQMSAKLALAGTLTACGGLYLWAGWIVSIWTSPADVMNGAPLLLLCLLPVRYIIHTVFVLSAAIFKASGRIRGSLLTELVIYALLSFTLCSWFGLLGLLVANVLSLLVGSLLPGMRLLERLAEFPPQTLMGVLLRSVFPILIGMVVLCGILPRPEGVTMIVRVAATTAWVVFCAGIAYLATFDQIERSMIGAISRLRLQSRSTS